MRCTAGLPPDRQVRIVSVGAQPWHWCPTCMSGESGCCRRGGTHPQHHSHAALVSSVVSAGCSAVSANNAWTATRLLCTPCMVMGAACRQHRVHALALCSQGWPHEGRAAAAAPWWVPTAHARVSAMQERERCSSKLPALRWWSWGGQLPSSLPGQVLPPWLTRIAAQASGLPTSDRSQPVHTAAVPGCTLQVLQLMRSRAQGVPARCTGLHTRGTCRSSTCCE